MLEHGTSHWIDSWQAAEVNAARWMRKWGHLDADVVSGTSDDGVDIRSSTALGRVGSQAHLVGTPVLQRLVESRGRQHHLELFFFSEVEYAAAAVGYADSVGMRLFRYDALGQMRPANVHARAVVRARRAAPARGAEHPS